MKTVFKVGMKVYDSFNFPNMEGVVKSIEKDCMGFWFIDVKFDKFQFVQSYKLQGSLPSSHTVTLSTKPYEVEFKGFEQKVETNFYDIYDRFSHVFLPIDYDENYHGYPTQELADAAEALRQLIFLRDYYNEGWQPNWKKEREIKYVIYNDSNKLATIQSYTFSYVLAFKEGNIRNKFLEEQRELLEKAKPLL